jgi:hypothetical protein
VILILYTALPLTLPTLLTKYQKPAAATSPVSCVHSIVRECLKWTENATHIRPDLGGRGFTLNRGPQNLSKVQYT